MNFGSDLNFAYAGDTNAYQTHTQQENIMEPVQKKSTNQSNYTLPSSTQSSGMGNNLSMEEQLALLKQELVKEKQNKKKNESSFISRFINKKKEMIKIFVLALIILLAISIHFVVKHYLKVYIMENDFNSKKEFLIRFSYPLTIFAIIWIVKAYKSSDII